MTWNVFWNVPILKYFFVTVKPCMNKNMQHRLLARRELCYKQNIFTLYLRIEFRYAEYTTCPY